MKKKSFIRFCKWSIFNGGLMWLAWTAVHGSDGAGRLLSFFAWITGILSFTGAMNDSTRAKCAKIGRSAPSWLAHGTGFTTIGFLVWYGWWWTAIAFFIAEISEVLLFDTSKEDKA